MMSLDSFGFVCFRVSRGPDVDQMYLVGDELFTRPVIWMRRQALPRIAQQ